MHDDRSLVEARLERALRQWLRPAQYADRVPLALSVWHVPGEPVPVDQALQASYEPFTVGTVWGKPWSTSWFRIDGRVPEEWAGRPVEVVIDPGFTGDGPGFQAEGLLYDAAGIPLKGIHPRNRHLTVGAPARGGEEVRLLLEAAANPAVLHGFEPTRLGDVLTMRRWADLPIRGCRSRRTRSGRLASGPRYRGPLGADVRTGSGAAAAARDPAGAGEHARRPRSARCLRYGGGCPVRAGGGPGAARVGERAPGLGGRARAHRLGVAVAAARDGPQGLPDVRQRHGPRGGLPGTGLRLLTGTAVRLGKGAPAAHLGAHQEGCGTRQLGPRGVDVGGVRRQHAGWRGAGPADRARQAVLPGGTGRRDRGDLAAGLLRLHRRLPATGEAHAASAGSSPRS